MTLFRRRRARRAELEAREARHKKLHTPPAVPLTRTDVQLLLTGLTESDRLRGKLLYTPRHGRSMAEIMRAAALAGALGHDTMPLPVSESTWSLALDLNSVHGDLVKWAPDAPITTTFGLLVLKIEALSALSSRTGWTCTRDRDANAWCWTTPPTVDAVTWLLPGA